MTNMRNPGGPLEQVGVCPHCASPRIRTRQRRHRHMIWRCRNCNRVFATPTLGMVAPGEWAGVDLVYPGRIQAMERQGRRRRQRGNGNVGCGCLFILLMALGIASFVAIGVNVDFPGAGTIRSTWRSVQSLFQGSPTEDGAAPAPVVELTPTPRSTAAAPGTRTATSTPRATLRPPPLLLGLELPHPRQELPLRPLPLLLGLELPHPRQELPLRPLPLLPGLELPHPRQELPLRPLPLLPGLELPHPRQGLPLRPHPCSRLINAITNTRHICWS